MTQSAIREIDAEDAEITAALRMSDYEAGPAIARARDRLERAHRAVRTMHAAPVKAFDYWFDEAKREAAGQSTAQGRLLAYLRGALKFERWIANPSEWPGSKFSEDQAHALATAAAAASQLAAMGLQFSAFGFVAALRGRGVTVTVNSFGKISLSPSAALNPTDREILSNPEKRHAVLAVLVDVEAFGP